MKSRWHQTQRLILCAEQQAVLPAVQWDAEASFGNRNAGTACESSRARGECLTSDKICRNLAKKPGEEIWGYLWGHFWRLAAQRIDLSDDVIVAASII